MVAQLINELIMPSATSGCDKDNVAQAGHSICHLIFVCHGERQEVVNIWTSAGPIWIEKALERSRRQKGRLQSLPLELGKVAR